MSRIAYVNGRYLPIGAPAIQIEDRGYQLADGVYEVCKVVAGRFRDLDRHLDRLERSLAALRIPMPMARRALELVMRETWRRNRLPDAMVYLQVSRGVAPRNHAFPSRVRPSLVVTVRPSRLPSAREMEHGVRVITLPDERWARCEIKSISLLPNVLAKQSAAEAGCREAWLVDGEGHRHGGRELERLHRRSGGQGGHAPARPGDPRRDHALRRRRACPRGRHRGGRAGLHRRRGDGRARGAFSPAPHPSCCP